ncbi:hypothetical protein [Afipia felis]|uniref:Protein involved in meta-pathway of phenol degradation n=2 Tax=Afipia felis TaxID=1035 RepID=A0A380W8K5_AFIFE|nr:hypothetical protein [Afipia felis]EKS28477.1 hypothetical protein HMPREF9697_01005 [Afipia felis ATCC 53690]SUU77185.1 Uncharacterised protein [Afipia felis]SUU85252.1 Uncharacterised protein [Afipia felis]
MIAVAAALVLTATSRNSALAGDSDEDDAKPTKADASPLPNIYLDMRTNYFTVPAGTLNIGFGNSLSLPSLSSLSSVSGQGASIDLPLTVDLNERFSVFGGITASTSKTDLTPWSSLAIASWNVGIQADILQQNGGPLPTVTVLSTLTKSATEGPLSTTNLTTVAEASYALDTDETRALLAGVQLTNIRVDSGLASIRPAIIGYVGAYYQWPNNWKLTGRAGVQSFGGANTSALAPFLPPGQSLLSLRSFTQPILRADLDRMDDNDNRLFGLTATLFWTPKPAFQFTLRTPLYFVRH